MRRAISRCSRSSPVTALRCFQPSAIRRPARGAVSASHHAAAAPSLFACVFTANRHQCKKAQGVAPSTAPHEPHAGTAGSVVSSDPITATAPAADAIRGAIGRDTTRILQLSGKDAEKFFFPGTITCRLCREMSVSPGEHIGLAPHQARYALLELLSSKLFRGPSRATFGDGGPNALTVTQLLQAEVRSWPERIKSVHHAVPAPCNANGALTALPERASRLAVVLTQLRGMGLLTSVIPASAASPRRSSSAGGGQAASAIAVSHVAVSRDAAFERIECIGDNTWGSQLSARFMTLFPDYPWLTSHIGAAILNSMRDYLEGNHNLEVAFNALNLRRWWGGSDATSSHLLGGHAATAATTTAAAGGTAIIGQKFKADVVEALMGDLHVALWSLEPLYPSSSLSPTERFIALDRCWAAHRQRHADVGSAPHHNTDYAAVPAQTVFLLHYCIQEVLDIVLLASLTNFAADVIELLEDALAVSLTAVRRPTAAASLTPLRTMRRGTATAAPPGDIKKHPAAFVLDRGRRRFAIHSARWAARAPCPNALDAGATSAATTKGAFDPFTGLQTMLMEAADAYSPLTVTTARDDNIAPDAKGASVHPQRGGLGIPTTPFTTPPAAALHLVDLADFEPWLLAHS